MSILPVYVGLDYHDDSVRVCVLSTEGDPLVNRDVANSPALVEDLILCHGVPRGVAIEACCGAADFATKLIELTGWDVRMAHPGYVAKLKKSRDKTDYGDAWLLADLLRVNYLPEVWIADERTRQLRRLVRYRESISSERKNTKLRIRSLLREERITLPKSRPWTKAWMEWLESVNLGEESRWIMSRLISELRDKLKSLQEIEKRMSQAVAGDALCRKLLEQAGVGLITAITLRAEIGRFDRFRTGKQLARFCGVTPRNASSGKRVADAGLIAESNKNLRRVLIEAAKRLPRHEPRWKELQVRLRRTKPANVVSAAIANRWIRSLYHQVKDVPLDETRLAA